MREGVSPSTYHGSREICGSRLIRNARNCSPANRMNVATPLNHEILLRNRTADAIPTTDATPITIVIAISVGENVPVTIRAHPSKNSQMNAMMASQKRKQGSAAHFAHPERRNPSHARAHTGAVCTICRITPCDTAPTTYSARIMNSAQKPIVREDWGEGWFMQCPFGRGRCF